jgi:hypothetical protein
MAIKGNAYTKTTWAFQERPVASAKLNLWDDRLEAALELAYFLLSHAWGGGSGVIRGATTDDLQVTAQSPASLIVEVNPGYAFIENLPYRLEATTTSLAFTAPTTNPRIDLIQARLSTWDTSVIAGTESATPVAPSPDADAIALAQIYLRPGMTSIKDSDDSTSGYIIDARTFL